MTETSIARRPPGEPDVENQYVRPFLAADLRLTLLPLLLPWVFRHATAAERRVLLRQARWPVRILLWNVEPRYLAQEVLFG